MAHVIGIAAVTAVVLLGTLLPFLPGDYDILAGPISMLSRILGKVGLLFVPIGALWVTSASSGRLAGRQYGIALAALVVLSIILGVISIGAFVSGSIFMSIAAIAASMYAVGKLLPNLRPLRNATPRRGRAVAFYLLIVPAAVALLQMMLLAPAVERSRNRAIRNSAQLIADIERYQAAHGRYPSSLLSVWRDYSPGIIGIRQYDYEPSGDAYNVVFEQPALSLGTREFVVYNPLDQQAMTSHKMDRLELTPEQLIVERGRGHYAVHEASYPHWKYFWFD